ncbi:MAG: gluconate 2-dehydrogenase subunit 3 family protein [Stellaceae bacterium]
MGGRHIPGPTRRALLTSTALAAVAAALPVARAETISGKEPWAPHEADRPEPIHSSDYVFFTPAEVAFVAAATERILPKDDLGPGARELNVPLFIDHQLAGAYGRADAWYMQGPWPKGADTQGFQSRMAPAPLYRAAIAAIDAHAKSEMGGKSFAALTVEQQDELLKQMEGGSLKLSGVDTKTFFKVLLQNTKEGAFSDPIYGGNTDMMGWKMLGFPGAHYDYTAWVGQHGVRCTVPPVGIMGRKGWSQG